MVYYINKRKGKRYKRLAKQQKDAATMKVSQQIKKFVTQKEDGKVLIKNQNCDIYLKIGKRWMNGASQTCVVISSIAFDEKLRGKGIFAEMVSAIAAHTPHAAIYVECIGNARLEAKLEREGWTRDEGKDVSYYKYCKNFS